MQILVSKLGSVVGTDNVDGEAGETEMICHHLVERGHNVTYFGHVRGDWPCRVTAPHMDNRWNSEMPGWLQREGFKHDAEAVEKPDVFIMVNGYSPTWGRVDNPNRARIFTAGVRFVAPQLALAENLKVPVININNDPRTYIKAQELTTMYTWLPCALLDQVNRTVVRKIGGVSLTQESVYAACETWIKVPPCPPRIRQPGPIVVAHAHVFDKIKERSRLEAWHEILSFTPKETRIYGSGFDQFDHGRVFLGLCEDPFELYQTHEWTPVLAHKDGFVPAKASAAARSGCVPLFLPHGEYSVRNDFVNPENTPYLYLGTHDIEEARKNLWRFDPYWLDLEYCLQNPYDDYGGYKR